MKNINYVFRHFEGNDAIKAYFEKKFNKISKLIKNIINVDVVFSLDKHHYTCDVRLHAKYDVYTSTVVGNDIRVLIDEVIDKLQAQILKDKKA